jgi:hypothetical protein
VAVSDAPMQHERLAGFVGQHDLCIVGRLLDRQTTTQQHVGQRRIGRISERPQHRVGQVGLGQAMRWRERLPLAERRRQDACA